MWNAFCLAAGEGFGVKYGWSIGKQSTGLFSLRRETRPFRATDSRSNYSNPCRLRKKTAVPNGTTVFLAAGEGFEPSQTESESGVLPLHKSAKCKRYYTMIFAFVNTYFKKKGNGFTHCLLKLYQTLKSTEVAPLSSCWKT